MYIGKFQNSLRPVSLFPGGGQFQSQIMFFPVIISKPKEKKECPFLVTFLDFLSALFVVPFRISKNPKSGEYYLHSSKFRRVAALIPNAYIIIQNLFWAIFSVANYADDKYDLGSAFYAVSVLTAIWGISALQYIFWWRAEDLLCFVEMTSLVAPSSTIRKQKLMAATFTLMYIVGPCIEGYYYNLGGVDSSSFAQFIEAGLITVGWEELVEMAAYRAIVEGVGFALFCISITIFNMQIMGMMMLALTFRNAVVNRFCPSLPNCEGDIQEVLDIYTKLKEVNALARSLFGPFILSFYLCTLSFVALFPLLILSSSGPMSAMLMGTHMFFDGVAVGLAAHCQSRIEEGLLVSTISHHWDEDCPTKDRLKLLALGQDMDRVPIGLSCSFVTITKRFISSTFGLVVTYSIIVFQMMEKEKRGKT